MSIRVIGGGHTLEGMYHVGRSFRTTQVFDALLLVCFDRPCRAATVDAASLLPIVSWCDVRDCRHGGEYLAL